MLLSSFEILKDLMRLTWCTHDAHMTYTRCTYVVYKMYTCCIQDVHMLYTKCTHVVEFITACEACSACMRQHVRKTSSYMYWNKFFNKSGLEAFCRIMCSTLHFPMCVTRVVCAKFVILGAPLRTRPFWLYCISRQKEFWEGILRRNSEKEFRSTLPFALF